MNEENYQKQILLKKAALERAAKNKEARDKEQLEGCTFAPESYSVPMKKFSGGSILNDRYAAKHVLRQNKARVSKQEKEAVLNLNNGLVSGATSSSSRDRAKNRQQQQHNPTADTIAGMLAATNASTMGGPASPAPSLLSDMAASGLLRGATQSPDSINTGGGRDSGSMGGSAMLSGSGGQRLPEYAKAFQSLMEATDNDENLVEMLDRERREWSKERMQLVQCIQLQQIELEQRATAAHERAAEIAKEFARAIVAFEERLFGIEDNVQKEIMGLKTISESLKVSAYGSRIDSLEGKLDLILNKMDHQHHSRGGGSQIQTHGEVSIEQQTSNESASSPSRIGLSR
jgi:hypothetical protein